MLTFLSANIGTIIVGAVLLCILAFSLWQMLKDRKKGGCGGNCSGCSGCAGHHKC